MCETPARDGSAIAPAETGCLIGDADPLLGTVQCRRQRRTRALRRVVLLRQMLGDDVLQARSVDAGEDFRGGAVVEMTEATGDALLQHERIVAAGEQVAIV